MCKVDRHGGLEGVVGDTTALRVRQTPYQGRLLIGVGHRPWASGGSRQKNLSEGLLYFISPPFINMKPMCICFLSIFVFRPGKD